METFDWSRFIVRIDINAPKEKLYNAWTSSAAIEHWFLRFCEYRKPDGTPRAKDETVQKGDTYLWRWHGYGDDTKEEGTILDMNGTDFFKFSFGKAGDCSVYIKEEQGKMIVELVQENIPTDDKGKQYYHVGCKSGWSFHLADMKSIFECGVDLRNKDEQLKNMLNS